MLGLAVAVLLAPGKALSAQSLRELRDLYQEQALDFSNDRQLDALQEVLRGLGQLAESRDRRVVAQARLVRYVFAAEVATYCGGIAQMPPLGLVPQKTREVMLATDARNQQAGVEALLRLFARQSAMALTAVRETGTQLPDGVSVAAAPEDPQAVGRQMRAARMLALRACKRWAEDVGTLKEGELVNLADEKAPLIAYLGALAQAGDGSPMGRARMLEAMAGVLEHHGESRWADDAEAIFLMEVPAAIGAVAGPDATPDEARAIIGAVEAVLAPEASGGEGRLREPGPWLQIAWFERCRTFGERYPHSPWAENMALAVAATADDVDRLRDAREQNAPGN